VIRARHGKQVLAGHGKSWRRTPNCSLCDQHVKNKNESRVSTRTIACHLASTALVQDRIQHVHNNAALVDLLRVLASFHPGLQQGKDLLQNRLHMLPQHGVVGVDDNGCLFDPIQLQVRILFMPQDSYCMRLFDTLRTSTSPRYICAMRRGKLKLGVLQARSG
jgi:hypothetical protein